MSLIKLFIDYILHLDKHLVYVIDYCGPWAYVIFFMIIFCETGLVVMPFLPGDSLLFAIGALSALGVLKVNVCFILLVFAAVLGDTVNYWIGAKLGPKVFTVNHRFLKREYLDRTHKFYERHGGKTIILARFIPIIRTFAPFVAGIGTMNYWKFVIYNITGGIVWVAFFLFGGYYFGNLPFVKRNFTLVIFAIIIISILPGVFEYLRQMKRTQPESEG